MKAESKVDASSGMQTRADSETKSDSKESESNTESNAEESNKTKDGSKKESTQTQSKGSTYKFRTFSCSICHKIFLSYVTMLKHRLSHKLSDGCLNESRNKDIQKEDSIETNNDKEAANQALATEILKRSKEVLFTKMKVNAQNSTSAAKNSKLESGIKPLINTTDLLEKLARGGITTETIEKSLNNNNKTKSSTKGQEVITIETNNNNTNILNLQLSASTSNTSKSDNNLNSNNSNNGLEDIILDSNDLELDVIKDGVIISQDLQQLIAVNDGKESTADGLPVNEVLLNLDDIENGNEVWITITDSSAYVQVPHGNTNSS